MAVTADARRARLETRRGLKMARSVHAYVRGSTEAFYRWLEASPTFARIPQGPEIWICGDCHLGNLGPLADADGAIDVQIRDLDQSVIANPAYDLIRLGLSLETAARSGCPESPILTWHGTDGANGTRAAERKACPTANHIGTRFALEVDMVQVDAGALFALAAVITSISTLIWSIRRKAG